MTHRLSGHTRSSSGSTERVIKNILFICIISFLFIGCNQRSLSSSPITTFPVTSNQVTASPAAPVTSPVPISPPIPSPSPTTSPYKVWAAPYLPEKLRSAIVLPDGYVFTENRDEADIALAVDNQKHPPSSRWIYALVAPFPTVPDGITSQELQAIWTGSPVEKTIAAPLLLDKSTLDVLTTFWGAPAANAVQTLPADQLLDYAWSNRPSWAIIPFELLDPRWKVLALDEQSPVRKDFDPAGYPLNIPFILSGIASLQPSQFNLPVSNRDVSKLTTVALTGVTAMVRATAWTMEYKGITYPAEDIGPLLSQADITHISNEIPFSPDCPFPTLTQENLVFCSKPSYIELLKTVGTDIIDLSGDHFMDYGADATLFTLQMYKDLGWPYYAGGANAEEARQPVKLINNGNKIAFMGCNVGCVVKNEIPCDAIATDTHPGAAQCDFNYISSEIPALRDEGYQVIFNFQDREYYTYTAQPQLVSDFGLAATAGAAIVSGDQAHQPHGFSFQNGSYIHYGLGNLFFDQLHFCPDFACDDAFIDRHVFYDGRYISTELITLRFVDFAKPRLMTPEERARLLEIVFKASGW
jgi:hypothetical protein